mgnify:FL=1
MKVVLLTIMAVVGMVLMVALTSVSAHHSFTAEFDINKPVTLEGTVDRMRWVNPHSWLHINVEEADGTVTAWKIEFGLPQGLYRRGWRKSDLPVGEGVTVEGYLAKDGTNTANARSVVLSDGRRLFAGTSASAGNK